MGAREPLPPPNESSEDQEDADRDDIGADVCREKGHEVGPGSAPMRGEQVVGHCEGAGYEQEEAEVGWGRGRALQDAIATDEVPEEQARSDPSEEFECRWRAMAG